MYRPVLACGRPDDGRLRGGALHALVSWCVGEAPTPGGINAAPTVERGESFLHLKNADSYTAAILRFGSSDSTGNASNSNFLPSMSLTLPQGVPSS